jgi:hypothetical protein
MGHMCGILAGSLTHHRLGITGGVADALLLLLVNRVHLRILPVDAVDDNFLC